MTPRLPTPIAIDGPASSGKSTVALELCARIGHLFFDTGILYRAVAAVALQRSVALADEQAITTLTEKLVISVQPESLAAVADATHINLNDHTNEGMRLRGRRAFSVQYHPEAGPGPHDARYLFAEFFEMLRES